MNTRFSSIIVFGLLCSGCASFRSDVSGLYSGSKTSTHATKVKVFFDLYHCEQTIGMDAIPKLLNYPGIRDWDDIFAESAKRLTNIASYQTFTNAASDVDYPNRRALRDSLLAAADYAVKIEVLRTKSFARHYLGGAVSFLTLTLVPMSFTWDYTVTVTITDRQHIVVAEYKRSGSVSTWYQLLLLPWYAFQPEHKQNEDLYLEMLSNVFQQIDSENILK
jgi:hypothetical protein